MDPGMRDNTVRRLEEAKGRFMDDVEDGEEPTRALAKAASTYGLSPDQIRLLGRAYNISLVESMRKEGGVAKDAFRSGPMADPEEAVRINFPQTKEAFVRQLIENDTRVSGVYAIDPPTEKTAFFAPDRVTFDIPLRPEDSELDDYQRRTLAETRRADLQLKKAALAEKSARILREADILLEEAADRIRQAGKRAAETFVQDPTVPFPVAYGYAASVLGKEAADRASNAILQVIPGLAEQGGIDDRPPHQQTFSPQDPCGRAFYDILKAVGDYEKSAVFHAACNRCLSAVAGQASPRPTMHGEDILDRVLAKTGGLGGTIAANIPVEDAVSKIPFARTEDALVRKALMKLTDPIHERELDQARATMMLTEMLTRDPVLKGFPAPEVLQYYNQISNAAPYASRNPAYVAPALRRSLQQGAMDPYEVDALLKLDMNLKRRMRADGGGYGEGNQ